MLTPEPFPPTRGGAGMEGNGGPIDASKRVGDVGTGDDDISGLRPGVPSSDRTLDSFATETGLPCPPESVELPDRIGPYVVLGELGRGGMGVVYRARDPELEREVALKVLPEQLSGDARAFARFRGEAKLLAAVNTPHIATIYSLETAGAQYFLSMELVPGRSLSERIRAAPLSLDEALSIARQVAVALEVAHRNGIVHLDLKPQNIMVTPEGQVKVLDFGLAMALGREANEAGEDGLRAVAQESIGGTPGYMSPEQIRGEAVDARADIWSFGCLLYESLSGKHASSRCECRPNGSGPRWRESRIWGLCLSRRRRTSAGCSSAAWRSKPAGGWTRWRKPAASWRRRSPCGRCRSWRPAPTRLPNNLPAQISSFFGRKAQKAEVARLLAENRLVTLTGVGGGGKTRLSLEVGRDLLVSMPDGVWLVELAPLAAPDLVPAAVASALALKDTAGLSPTELLLRHLGTRDTLLILDNCEHLLDTVARLCVTLLASCARLRILATSREVIGVPGEVTFHVPSLRVPDADRLAGARGTGAVRVGAALRGPRAGRAARFPLTSENAAAVARSAGGSTGSRWPWSWPRRERRSFPPTRSPGGLMTGSVCSLPRAARRSRGTRRCGR